MKKKIVVVLGVIIGLFIAYVAYVMLTTRSHSPVKETSMNHEGLEITVRYCQPYKKDRLIFGTEAEGALVPFNTYWRLGANDATEISFSRDVKFAGSEVKAGKYRMYAVPGQQTWEVSLNSELGQFGYFEPNYELDVLKVKVNSTEVANALEQFTINFANDSNGVIMSFEWDKTLVAIPIH
ncbi:MAG: DUF2911 domain-containing protein [Flammeovirgaceae bacterium]